VGALWSQTAGQYMNRTFRRLLALSIMFMTACTPVPQSPTLPTRTMGFADSLPPMRSDLRALLGRLRNEANIDIFMTGAESASITIEAIPRAVLNAAVPRAACFVVPRVSSWEEFKQVRRTPTVDWTTLERRDRAAVFVPSDVAPQEIRDCLHEELAQALGPLNDLYHEELAQALGPLNDLYRLSDSVFNDDNIHAVLTSFDMLILRAYYDPALANGMTRGQVAARLNPVLARLNPTGEGRQARPQNDTTREGRSPQRLCALRLWSPERWI